MSLFHRRPVTRPEPSALPHLTRSDRRILFWTTGLRWLLTLAALAALLYLAAQIFARTDTMRVRLEAMLTDLAGMPVRIDGRIRATEALNLKIRDVICLDGDSGMTVAILRIRWRLFPPRGESHIESIWAENVQLTLSRLPDGTIRPPQFARLGRKAAGYIGVPALSIDAPATVQEGAAENAMPGQPPSSEPSSAAPDETTAEASAPAQPRPVLPLLRIQNARVRWLDADGTELASATGIDATIRTLALPEIGMNPLLGPGDVRSVTHLRGYAAAISVTSTVHITGLRLDLIQAGAQTYLSHLSAADWGQHPPPASPSLPPDALLLRDPGIFPD